MTVAKLTRKLTVLLEQSDAEALERVRQRMGERYDVEVLRALIRDRDAEMNKKKEPKR